MNPEGKKTLNTGANIDKRIQKSIEARDQTNASQSGQTSKTKSAQNQETLQEKIARIKSQAKLNALKQQHPHLFPNTQTPNSPSASSEPSPN
ncbi:hypothetical protein A0J48_010280 [Sphaerospermopsis aphanizomenoides BCCUSP55]|uniref:hypothetical protein n=1 Tax=Sphaerospermopsis aphanizomenoides TaxID=459663 RepID=UPI001908742A|nr:hypothetical protein [Sphaerospermopsis aphanizomenoides]MBK1987922.1 hypothetical protein [Sphaerospermopsis aphanizomenoides BCCUSP55]